MFLILEDEPLIALDLQMAFEDAGHEAKTVSTCDDAIELLASRALSGAVLDVSLGGGETCEAAAGALADRSLPFLLHTGDLNRVGEGLRKYGVPILEKPMSSEAVVARLLDMVTNRSA